MNSKPSLSIPIQSKLPKTGISIFAIMSQLAAKHNAINLSQGFPNFDSPPELISLVHQYMQKGFNQYAPMPGLMSLREKLAEKAENLYGAELNPETEITITDGATQAIYTALTALLGENDEVIIFEPAYDSYVPSILLSGAKPVFIQLRAPDYRIPWEDVKKVINTRTRMLIFNSPHNPTGTVWQKEDLLQLQRIVKDSNLLILSDEVYEHLTYDGLEHESILKYPELFQRSCITYSFGKTYHSTGWKVGYIAAPEYLMNEIRKVHQYVVFSVNTPVQYALADYLDNPNHYLELSAFFQEKRDFFLRGLEGSKFKFKAAQGSYFQLLDYSNISDIGDVEFAEKLTTETGVASIPISVFNHDGFDERKIRFCFAKKQETLERALERLNKLS